VGLRPRGDPLPLGELVPAALRAEPAAAVDERASFGGYNGSGIGRELGRQGLHEFTETHVMAVPSDG
jgi:hypothetical protein